jgi:hypothetical protein
MAVEFRIVFDAATAGYRDWPWVLLMAGLFVALVIWIIIDGRLGPRRGGGPRRAFLSISAVFVAAVTAGIAWTSFRDHAALRAALKTGRYQVVEGLVTDFRPMPREGHQLESFVIAGRFYSYSDFVRTAGFNNTASHGGPIREGLYVRIADVNGQIARLEIATLSKGGSGK